MDGETKSRMTFTTMRHLTACVALFSSINIGGLGAANKEILRFSTSPGQYGYDLQNEWISSGRVRNLLFLNDNLLLLTADLESACTDCKTFEARLILIDLSKNYSVCAFATARNRAGGTVRITGDRFGFLGPEALTICDRNLNCGAQVTAGIPLFASPSGNRIAVGGMFRTQQKLFDSRTMDEIPIGQTGLTDLVIPGDHNLLIEKGDRLYAADNLGLVNAFPIDFDGTWRQGRFLSGKVFGRFVSKSSEAVVDKSCRSSRSWALWDIIGRFPGEGRRFIARPPGRLKEAQNKCRNWSGN